MKIVKNNERAGFWTAEGKVRDQYFVGCSDNKIDALQRMFDKIYWVMDLERPIKPIDYGH